MKLPERIAQAARLARVEEQLTQKEAGRRLGVSRVHLWRLENGHNIISLDMLERMNELYDTDVYIQAKADAP